MSANTIDFLYSDILGNNMTHYVTKPILPFCPFLYVKESLKAINDGININRIKVNRKKAEKQ